MRSRIEAIEAMMVQDAFDREAAAATARVSAGLVLPAAAVARGMPVPPRRIPANDPLEVLVEKRFAGGRVRVLYRMPWPAASEAAACGDGVVGDDRYLGGKIDAHFSRISAVTFLSLASSRTLSSVAKIILDIKMEHRRRLRCPLGRLPPRRSSLLIPLATS